MTKVFVVSHGVSDEDSPLKLPPYFKVSLYADPGEGTLMNNACAAINSGGGIGARQVIDGAVKGRRHLPSYTLTPLKKDEVKRFVDSVSSATGGPVYILGNDVDHPGVRALEAPQGTYSVRKLLLELGTKHSGNLDVHLLCCLHDAEVPAGGDRDTIAVGSEHKTTYDADPRHAFPEWDHRYYPSLRRKRDQIHDDLKQDPQRTMRNVGKSTRAQLDLKFDEKAMRHVALSPNGPREYLEMATSLFPRLLSRVAFPALQEALSHDDVRFALTAYLNLESVSKAPPGSGSLVTVVQMIDELRQQGGESRFVLELDLQECIQGVSGLWGTDAVNQFDDALQERRTIAMAEGQGSSDLLADLYGCDRSELAKTVAGDAGYYADRTREAEYRAATALEIVRQTCLTGLDPWWTAFTAFFEQLWARKEAVQAARK
ncbi:hypothetical protein ACTVZO_39460 [Streptomyces sp. IBSNAI002]|uniref:hypothetical protein n=1 Tax=Streptomyces sp. IBSNAI002 TaxID=3457500 RepID=UPI003FD17313